ncbi:MAG: hypothetical protein OXH61_06030 [Acidimicrobiaceae bacterium]|nr:hypothetical protein [Acidimicrobiaceae bacterium]
MELTGQWRATTANDEMRRTFHQPELDDRAWSEITVPGHWSSHPEFAEAHAVLHRTRFVLKVPDVDRRCWLWLDGVCQQGDIWLNGRYVGTTDGYFISHGFDITEHLEDRSDHLLAVDVTCAPDKGAAARTSLLGALIDPELSGTVGENPGGIWRPVRIRETGSTAVLFSRTVCLDADPTSATLALRCVFDTPDAGPVVLRTRVCGHEHELEHPAAAGENRVEWTVDVPEPELWWPHSLGDQPLHDLRCEVVVDGEVSDSFVTRVGFRSVRMRNWILHVNGERLFVKGIGMLPTSARPGDASAAEVAEDVLAAKRAGLNMIRVISHIARPEVYETADEIGMLLWQDFPLRGQMARGVRPQATRQAREAVDLLGHHPSVTVWCAHDEPFKKSETPAPTPPLIGQQTPSWNRTVLDRSVRRVLNRTDGSRPVVTHTAVPPTFPDFDGTTSHLWFGWHHGRAADLAAAAARIPRMARFVTAFGAATVERQNPHLDLDNPDGPQWPTLDWAEIAASIGAPSESLLHLVAPERARDAEDWARMTGVAQAEVIKTSIELLRRLKYRPTVGFSLFYLADASEAGGFGVLDRQRRAKPGWQALLDACRPVIVVADPLRPLLSPGEEIDLAVHVVSDERTPIDEAQVQATVRANITGGGSAIVSEQRWGGTIPGDDCSLIGRVNAIVPGVANELVVSLKLTAEQLTVTNDYRTPVHSLAV